MRGEEKEEKVKHKRYGIKETVGEKIIREENYEEEE